MNNPFITLENLRRFLENLRSDITDQGSYIDRQDNSILATAKSYTEYTVNNAINTADGNATEKTDVVQSKLNTHMDNVTDAHDMANRLQALKSSMSKYTDQSISTVVGAAPELLNTLYEFSNAIGNDPNFGASTLNLLGQKLGVSDVVITPTPNKVLRLDANSQYPPIVIAQDLNNRFFTDVERIKLAGIAAGATNYTHPVTHLPSIIAQDNNNRFVTDVDISRWNAKQAALTLATEVADGIMSASDKLKLNYIENGANKTIITNNLTTTLVGTALDAAQGKILSDTKAPLNHASSVNTYGWGDSINRGHVGVTSGNGLGITNGIISLALASQSANGAFSSIDKLKLDGIANGATNYIHPDTHPASMITGVLPLSNGGTGVSSKQSIIQLLYDSLDKNSVAKDSLYTFAFEASGANCGWLKLNDLKTKLQWTTSELQAALLALPNI